MVKKIFNPADYRQKQEKKLNEGRKPGFIYDIVVNDEHRTIVYQNASTDTVLSYINDKQYLCKMYTTQPCTCIVCNLLLFKLLNLPTMWALSQYSGKFVYYFAPVEEETFELLKSIKKQGIISVCKNYSIIFNKHKLPKFCPDWGEYRVASLPTLTPKILDTIEFQAKRVFENIKRNEPLFFNINRLKPIYNAPLALSAKLGKTVLSINAHIVLEHLLQVMTHSSAVIDNTYSYVYVANYPDFRKAIAFQGRHGKKDETIKICMEELQTHGIIDNYLIVNDNLYFASALITKHIKQRIRRNLGYYSQLPPTKQAPIIATFLNYLNWILNAPTKYTRLTIALDTLLVQLGLERLLTEHRNGEIARVLTTLRNVGVQYGLLQMPENAGDISSSDVKYLLVNRTELHKYITLNSAVNNGKESK